MYEVDYFMRGWPRGATLDTPQDLARFLQRMHELGGVLRNIREVRDDDDDD